MTTLTIGDEKRGEAGVLETEGPPYIERLDFEDALSVNSIPIARSAAVERATVELHSSKAGADAVFIEAGNQKRDARACALCAGPLVASMRERVSPRTSGPEGSESMQVLRCHMAQLACSIRLTSQLTLAQRLPMRCARNEPAPMLVWQNRLTVARIRRTKA